VASFLSMPVFSAISLMVLKTTTQLPS